MKYVHSKLLSAKCKLYAFVVLLFVFSFTTTAFSYPIVVEFSYSGLLEAQDADPIGLDGALIEGSYLFIADEQPDYTSTAPPDSSSIRF